MFKEPETKIIQITTPQANSASAKDKSSETFADDKKALMAAADTLESPKNSVPVKDKSSETFADDRKALMAADKKNTNPNVEYKNFKDEACGFSFDYPIRIGDKQLNEIQQSSVHDYYINLSEARVEISFDRDNNIYDVNRLMSACTNGRFDDFKTKKISDTEFLVTFIITNERANGVQKNFFVRDKYDKKIYHYYVRYIYNDKTPADQDAICKHIFESFKPPS